MDRSARRSESSGIKTKFAIKAPNRLARKNSDEFHLSGISGRVAWYDFAMMSQIALK
jgi:hypothetical protein